MMHRSAEFTENGKYRQRLDRWWGDGPRVGWLMCNPSTASDKSDDATIRRCIGFTARWGYQGLTVINPFDLVCTDSALLPHEACPVSVRNIEVLSAVARDIELLIVAWGCESVLRAMKKRGFDPFLALRHIRAVNPALPIECLSKSKSGWPHHPLRLPYLVSRQPFDALR